MADIHGILFNMQIMYSVALGIYAAWLAANATSGATDDEDLVSGNYWGAVLIYAGLNVVVLFVGTVLAFSGYTIASEGRQVIYFLYMAFLIVIMPGLFSMLRGRDDRQAAIYFSMLAFFNAAVSFSMVDRGLALWVAA